MLNSTWKLKGAFLCFFVCSSFNISTPNMLLYIPCLIEILVKIAFTDLIFLFHFFSVPLSHRLFIDSQGIAREQGLVREPRLFSSLPTPFSSLISTETRLLSHLLRLTPSSSSRRGSFPFRNAP